MGWDLIRNSVVAPSSLACPSGHITVDMRIQPSAFAQVLATQGLQIRSERYVIIFALTKKIWEEE